MVWTSSLDLDWNDLALKPVFLPFVHQTVRTLAGFEDRPAALTVGQVATPDSPADQARPRVVVGRLRRVPPRRGLVSGERVERATGRRARRV